MESTNKYRNLPYSEKILSKDEQRMLVVDYHNTSTDKREDILLRLIGSNWKLVFSLARKYYKSLDINTAMSVGFMGLIRAIDKIDLSRGTSLTTVAYHWIRMELNRASTGEIYTIPIPEHTATVINKKIREMSISSNFEENVGNDYTYDQLNAYYAYHQERIALTSDTTRNVGINNYIESYEPTSDCDNVEYINALIDIKSALNKIKDIRIRNIMIAYFDLSGNGSITLEQLGEKYSLTKERIRQLIVKGKKILMRELSDYNM